MSRKIDYSTRELHAAFDAAFRTVFLAAVFFAGLHHQEFFVTLDGTHRPFYGKSYAYGDDQPKVREDDLTTAGRWTTGAFKASTSPTRRGDPMYPGTLHKHDYFQLSGHLYKTQESFPLAIRRGLASAASTQELLAQLDALPRLPAMLFADKAFANEPQTEVLRRWCDPKRVAILIAMPKRSGIRKIVQHDWHTGIAQPVPNAPEVMLWSVRRHHWREKPQRPYNLLTLYFQGKPRKELFEENHDLLRLPKGYFAICFYTNIDVTSENVYWLSRQYSYRWSCENLYKRCKATSGRSGSHSMFLRDFMYNTAMLMHGTYALWRLERSRRLNLRLHDPTVSMSRYFGDLQTRLRDRLRAEYLHIAPVGAPARFTA